MSGPARGRRKRAMTFRALLPCLKLTVGLIAFERPRRRPRASRRTCSARCRAASSRRRICRCAGPSQNIDKTGEDADAARLRDKDAPAPSRIGSIPTYGLPAANGAADSGFDSLNRTRKKPKLYPGQAKPKPSPGPGSPAPPVRHRRPARRRGFRFRRRRPPTRRRWRRRWPAPSWASRRASASRSTTIRSARSAITPAAF